MSIFKTLSEIQSQLKAPKGQKNSFGNYKYRSCEDILESLKPILSNEGCCIILRDTMIEISGRFYIEAVATIFNETGDSVNSKSYARESENKKGMDSAQITGSASSYARKYALNGLLAIDDSKDDDTRKPSDEAKKTEPVKKPKLEDSKLKGCEEWSQSNKDAVKRNYSLTEEQLEMVS